MTVTLSPSSTQGSLLVNGTASLVFDANGMVSGQNAPQVRQTVQYGAVNNSGYANMLSAGTGLTLNLAATTVPMKTAFAAGVQDYIATLSADVAGAVTLPATNLSFVSQDWVSATSVTWGSSLALPQYGYAYNMAAQSCLSLNNTNLDDFGNSWINTAVTFSNSSPAIAGTYMGVFNGTTSYIRSAAFTTLGSAGWTLRCKFIPTAVGTTSTIFNAGYFTGYGATLYISSSKLDLYLSSTGSSWDIANAVVGTSTLVNGTTYDLELTYDAVTGKYYTYLNGVADSALTITSTSIICPVSNISVGANSVTTPSNFFSGSIQGFEFLPYCKHPAGITFTPQTTLSNVATQGYASDWFSIPQMTMYQVSAASTVSGTNPTFTAKNRTYVGQAVTGAAAVSSVVNYALNGKYSSVANPTTFAASTTYTFSHNLGLPIEFYNTKLMVRTAVNYPWYENSQTYNGAWPYNSTSGISRNTSAVAVISSMITNQSTTTVSGTTITSGQLAINVNRNF